MGGYKQRYFMYKEDTISPTVATESFLLTCIIDAEKHIDVVIVDIPNVFIQTRIEDKNGMAIINIGGVLVDTILKIAPDVYESYVITDLKGVMKLIVQCQNAIYGTITEILIHYNKFRKILEDEGYEFNPYDLCVANNIIKVSQRTVCFHGDNCKLIQHSPKVVGKTNTWLK